MFRLSTIIALMTIVIAISFFVVNAETLQNYFALVEFPQNATITMEPQNQYVLECKFKQQKEAAEDAAVVISIIITNQPRSAKRHHPRVAFCLESDTAAKACFNSDFGRRRISARCKIEKENGPGAAAPFTLTFVPAIPDDASAASANGEQSQKQRERHSTRRNNKHRNHDDDDTDNKKFSRNAVAQDTAVPADPTTYTGYDAIVTRLRSGESCSSSYNSRTRWKVRRSACIPTNAIPPNATRAKPVLSSAVEI